MTIYFNHFLIYEGNLQGARVAIGSVEKHCYSHSGALSLLFAMRAEKPPVAGLSAAPAAVLSSQTTRAKDRRVKCPSLGIQVSPGLLFWQARRKATGKRGPFGRGSGGVGKSVSVGGINASDGNRNTPRRTCHRSPQNENIYFLKRILMSGLVFSCIIDEIWQHINTKVKIHDKS